MTPQEIQAEMRAFRNSIGPKASVGMRIDADEWNDAEPPVCATLYPFGVCKSEGNVYVRSHDFRSAIDALKAKWEDQSAEWRAQTLKKMALAIIRITAENGDCSDAALRQEFDAAQIRSLGGEACALADRMASSGPFKIRTQRGANAA